MNEVDLAASQGIQFIEDQAIDWHNVRRTRFQFYQRFYYEYPGPIRDLRQRLIVVPAERYGAQQVSDHYLAINPSPMLTRQTIDRFGNRILEIYISEANRAVSFELLMVIESEAYGSHNPAAAFDDPVHLLQQTALTAPDATIKAVAQQLQREATTPHNLVERINDWVYTTMRYQRGATTVDTTAAQAVALGKGMCQDYAHVMLSLCRAAQLPARYISGHLLGEGGSHAWVEVFLPAQSGFERLAFDPTNHRRPHLGYVTVAVGRDYHDVSPTSGTFTAPYGGQLTCSKRAGATLIEFSNGETLQSHPLHG